MRRQFPSAALAILLNVAAAHGVLAQNLTADPPLTGTFTTQGGVRDSFKFNPAPARDAVVSGVNKTRDFVLYDVSHASKGVITLYLLAPPSRRMGTDYFFEVLLKQDSALTPGTYDFQTLKGADSQGLKGTLFAAIQPQRRPPSGASPASWSALNYSSPPSGSLQVQITTLDSSGDRVLHAEVTGTLISASGAPPTTFRLAY